MECYLIVWSARRKQKTKTQWLGRQKTEKQCLYQTVKFATLKHQELLRSEKLVCYQVAEE